MIYQSKPYSCGPAAVHNACNFVYGSSELCPDEEEILAHIECFEKSSPTDGTSHVTLKRVLTHFEVPFTTFSVRRAKQIRYYLDDLLLGGKAIICHGNEKKHWFVIIAVLYRPDYFIDGVVVVDSADADIVIKWPLEKLMTEWAGTEGDRRCYGIVVG